MDEGRPEGLGRRAARLVARFARAHPGPLAIALTGASLYAVGVVAGTVVIGRVIDRVVVPALDDGDTSMAAIVGAGVAIVAVALVRSAGIIGRRYFGSMAATRYQVTLREQLADHYLGVDLAYHRNRPTGDLLTTLDNDVERTTHALHPLPLSVSVLILAAVAVGSLLVVDPVLAALALLLVPTLAVVNRQFSRRMEGPASTAQRLLGELGSLAHESFDGALVVKTLGREADEVERFAAQAARLRDARIAIGRVRASFEPFFDLLPALASIAVVAVGAWRVSQGAMTTGQLVQAVTLFSVLAFPLRVLGFFLEGVPMAIVALDRIDDVLRDGQALRPPTRPRELPAQGPLGLRVEHVSQHHGSVAVLDDVTFTLHPGEVVALVGATGSGKSTLCELLVRLADPDAGTVEIGGVPLTEADPLALRQRVALVLQEPFLFADAVTANVLFDEGTPAAVPEPAPAPVPVPVPVPGEPALTEALARARADHFVEQLPHGPHTLLGERGVTLSGGQRQRLALARALALHPGLLILDDATSAVDAVVEAEILAGLRGSARPATLLIVAHRLSTIRLADRVLFLERGRLAASGRHDDLLSRPGYAELARAYERASVPDAPPDAPPDGAVDVAAEVAVDVAVEVALDAPVVSG